MSIHDTAAGSPSASTGSADDRAITEFEIVYRANVADVGAFFARRSSEPQLVADLTSETFVQAIASLDTFDPRRGSARGWVFGIARRVYAQHCQRSAASRAAAAQFAGRRELDAEETEELEAKIDAQHAGRELLARCAQLSAQERGALELVDIVGLEPRHAARLLGIPPGVLRARLFRARKRLRKSQNNTQEEQ